MEEQNGDRKFRDFMDNFNAKEEVRKLVSVEVAKSHDKFMEDMRELIRGMVSDEMCIATKASSCSSADNQPPLSERQKRALMNCGFRYCQREDGEEGMEVIWEDRDVVIAWNRFDETRRDWLSLYVDEKRISRHNDLASLLCSMIRSFLYGLGQMIADKFVSGC